MRDITIKSIIAGSVGGLLYQLFVWGTSVFGGAKITPVQLGAYMLIKPGLDITTPMAQILGIVQHFSNSILLAFLISYIVLRTGTDFKILKGIILGGIVYFALYGVIGRFIVPVSILQPDLVTSTSFMLGNQIYGLTVVYITSILPQDKSKSKN